MRWAPSGPFRSEVTLGDPFLRDLGIALDTPPRGSTALGWSFLLMPPRVTPELALPHDALITYQRLDWQAPVAAGTFELEATLEWCSNRSAHSEVGVACSARRHGVCVAQSLMVLRVGGHAQSWGIRAAPPVPDCGGGVPSRSIVVSAREVDHLAVVGDASYRMNLDARFAHRLGFPNALVPSVMLLAKVTGATVLPDEGVAEAWFHRPVPVGSVLELRSSEDDGTSVWAAYPIGSPVPAVTARIRPGAATG